jgi:hypothetical protein
MVKTGQAMSSAFRAAAHEFCPDRLLRSGRSDNPLGQLESGGFEPRYGVRAFWLENGKAGRVLDPERIARRGRIRISNTTALDLRQNPRHASGLPAGIGARLVGFQGASYN